MPLKDILLGLFYNFFPLIVGLALLFGGTFVMIRFVMWTIRTGKEKEARLAAKSATRGIDVHSNN